MIIMECAGAKFEAGGGGETNSTNMGLRGTSCGHSWEIYNVISQICNKISNSTNIFCISDVKYVIG